MGIEPTAEAWELSEMATYAPLSVRTNMSIDKRALLAAGGELVHGAEMNVMLQLGVRISWRERCKPGPRHHPNVRRVGSSLWTTEARTRAGSQTKFTIQTSCRCFPLWPPSSRGILSPSPLLALLYYFAQVRDRPYLNRSKSILKPRLL